MLQKVVSTAAARVPKTRVAAAVSRVALSTAAPARRTLTVRAFPAAPRAATFSHASPVSVACGPASVVARMPARGFAAAAKPEGAELLTLPALSPTMEVGSVAKWHKVPGDKISPGDLICDIETDKAVVGFEAQEESILAAVIVSAGGGTLPVGATLGVTVEDADQVAAAQEWAKTLSTSSAVPVAAAPAAAPAAPAPAPTPAPAPASPKAAPKPSAAAATSGSYTHLPFSPSVAHLLGTLRIDPASLRPTGPKGRLLKGDVLAAVEDKTAVYLPADTAAAKPASASAAAAKPVATAAAGGPPGLSARRLAARTYADLPLSSAAVDAATAQAATKRAVPHMYLQRSVPSAGLTAFAQRAGVSAEALYVRAAAHAMAALAPGAPLSAAVAVASAQPRAEPEQGARARVVVPGAAAAPVSAIDRALAAGPTAQQQQGGAAALAVTFLAGAGPVPFGIDILPPGAAAAVTVGAPAARTTAPAGHVGGEPVAVKELASVETTMISLAVDARVMDELQAAKVLQTMAENVEDPENMLF